MYFLCVCVCFFFLYLLVFRIYSHNFPNVFAKKLCLQNDSSQLILDLFWSIFCFSPFFFYFWRCYFILVQKSMFFWYEFLLRKLTQRIRQRRMKKLEAVWFCIRIELYRIAFFFYSSSWNFSFSVIAHHKWSLKNLIYITFYYR